LGLVFTILLIIFAGIVIGATGAIIDMSISIASALWELKDIKPSFIEIYKSGITAELFSKLIIFSSKIFIITSLFINEPASKIIRSWSFLCLSLSFCNAWFFCLQPQVDFS